MNLCIVDGCERKRYGHGFCQMHYLRLRRGTSLGGPETRSPGMPRGMYQGPKSHKWKGGRAVDKQGYVRLNIYPGDEFYEMGGGESKFGCRIVLEHRLVMARTLARPLLSTEEVHHRNGVRGDNRPENLELWVRSQPPGHRAEDLVSWAREIIARYG